MTAAPSSPSIKLKAKAFVAHPSCNMHMVLFIPYNIPIPNSGAASVPPLSPSSPGPTAGHPHLLGLPCQCDLRLRLELVGDSPERARPERAVQLLLVLYMCVYVCVRERVGGCGLVGGV